VLPWVHRAPVGRLQVVQAMEDGMTLLIVDASLKQWGGL
jgi:PIN domain nuclease of toxin-antitoxin system